MGKKSIEKELCSAYFRYASETIEAYSCVKLASKTSSLNIRYYLLCRTIELSLKAILIRAGRKEKEMKEVYGHNITLLARSAIDDLSILRKDSTTLIRIADFDVRCIKKAGKYYSKKEFEYFKIGKKEVPTLDDLENVSEHLVNAVQEEIKRIDF